MSAWRCKRCGRDPYKAECGQPLTAADVLPPEAFEGCVPMGTVACPIEYLSWWERLVRRLWG